jgi:multiple sugar transport system permease protein
MAMNIWASFGYYTILFLAGLQTIPEALYEAAALDGATEWQKFKFITFPHLKPIILLVVVINTIYSLQVFPEIFTMTMGGPLGSTTTAVYHIYELGFHRFEMGKASAAAYLLSVIIVLFSLAQMKLLKTDEELRE